MSARRALLAGSAPLTDRAWVARQIKRQRGPWLVVAANGGRRHLDLLGIAPDVAIGDFDSAPPSRGPAGRELVHPREKDETDLELAFLHAFVTARVSDVVVIGALGARFDHTLTNLNLGARWARRGLGVTYLDGAMRVRFTTGTLALERDPQFDTVSLIPHSAAVRGIDTEGLAYPLRSGTLWRNRGRGVSNQLVSRRGRITVGSGLLMVVETRS